MTYFSGAPANINALFDLLDAQLVAEGATQTVLNSSTAVPPALRAEREAHYKFPGNDAGGVSAQHHVGIMRVLQNAGAHALQFYGFTGTLPPIAINTTDQAGTLVTVNTVAAHPLVTGDIVALNGTNNTALHSGDVDNAAPSTITKTGPSQFTYTSPFVQAIVGATGGVAVPLFNLTAGRTIDQGLGGGPFSNVVLNDAAMTVIGYVDKFRLVWWITQGATLQPVFLGTTSRTHIQDDESDIGRTTGALSSGAGVTVTLEAARANLYDGQPLFVVSPTDGTYEVTNIITVLGPTQFTANLANNYPSGALVGADAMPLLILATNSSPALADLNNRNGYCPWTLDGTRTNPVAQDHQFFAGQESAAIPFIDPDAAGRRQATSVSVLDGGGAGIRGRAVGMIALPAGGGAPVPANNDIARTTSAANAPTGDYKIIQPGVQELNPGGWAVAVGPEAT
jgi:hypothetical protein